MYFELGFEFRYFLRVFFYMLMFMVGFVPCLSFLFFQSFIQSREGVFVRVLGS